MTEMSRRQLLSQTTMLAGAVAIGAPVQADVPAGRDAFDYEVTRSEAEWRALLGEDFGILREGKTEVPRSSPLWAEAREGTYSCRGCELLQYKSSTKINLLTGWLFFSTSEPNAQLMSQDSPPWSDEESPKSDFDAVIEVHCRRCGSHMGHILLIEGRVLHCINGASLTFSEAEI